MVARAENRFDNIYRWFLFLDASLSAQCLLKLKMPTVAVDETSLTLLSQKQDLQEISGTKFKQLFEYVLT